MEPRTCIADTGVQEGFCWTHLVDEAVVDDGAADLLVELEERLHLVHRDLAQLNARKRASDRTALRENGGRTSQAKRRWGKIR